MDIAALYQLDTAPAIQRLLCCRTLDRLMEALSTAGEGWFLVLVVVALAWKANPVRQEAIRSALLGLTSLAVTGALVVGIKHLVRAPRPLQLLGPEQVRELREPLRLMSFPSGHSAAAAALAMWASRQPSVGTRRWPWLLALLVGLSRVYVGAHWVTDVVGGWLLGVATAALVDWAWPRPRRAMAGLAGLAEAGTGPAEAPASTGSLE